MAMNSFTAVRPRHRFDKDRRLLIRNDHLGCRRSERFFRLMASRTAAVSATKWYNIHQYQLGVFTRESPQGIMEKFQQVEILLVEDNPLDAELTRRALIKGGLANQLLRLEDGQQALDYLFRRGLYENREPTLPRLVLLDLKMPRVDGIEVLRAVRTDPRTRRLPVVIMTSSEEEKDITQTYDLGINGYVVKPVQFAAFAEVVRQVGFYWLAINRAPP